MQRKIAWAIVVLCLGISGCDDRPNRCPPNRPCPNRGGPPVDLPDGWRVHNYAGGSCMWASVIPLMHWQGLHATANRWRSEYGGAAGVPDLAREAERDGLRYAWTGGKGDVAFLEWCSETRRGAAIHYGSNHAQTFCGFADGYAWIIDNNRPGVWRKVPRAEFVEEWKRQGSYALTLVYSPAVPQPWK